MINTIHSPSPAAHNPTLPEELVSLSNSIDWLRAEEAEKYLADPRDRYKGAPVPVFLPRNTLEVSALVTACHEHEIKIVPYGGGTGVVAGQLVFDAEKTIIISLERMNSIRSVSALDSAIVAEAGCILADIHTAAKDVGMTFPLRMASEGSSMIGGNLATNCGGVQVLRYGNARDLCLGIEAVLPDGSILNELAPLRKNNAGYDLRHLMIGSEGTLGIITAASLSLKPADREVLTVFCAVGSPDHSISLLSQLRNALGNNIHAFELMCDHGFSILAKHFPEEKFPLESRHDWYVLMEIAGADGLEDRVTNLLAESCEEGFVKDAVVAASQAQSDALWRLREYTPEANRLNQAVCSSDTSVQISQIPKFIDRVYEAIASIDPAFFINCYGHIGDGNIHFNIFPPTGQTKQEIISSSGDLLDKIRGTINEVTVSLNGSISAEHGIGRLKSTDFQHFSDPVKFALCRTIKSALDQKGIMNPGALIGNDAD